MKPLVLLALILMMPLGVAQIENVRDSILTKTMTPQRAAFEQIDWTRVTWQPAADDEQVVTRVLDNRTIELAVPDIQAYNTGRFPLANMLADEGGVYTQFYHLYLTRGETASIQLRADNFRPSLSFRRPQGEIVTVLDAELREGVYYATLIINATQTGHYVVAVRAEDELVQHGEYSFRLNKVDFSRFRQNKDAIQMPPPDFHDRSTGDN